MQGAVQAGKVLLRKVKGTENPGNFLTKHAKTGKEAQKTLLLAWLTAKRSLAPPLCVKTDPPTQWKLFLPSLIGVTIAQQILGIFGQEYEGPLDQILFGAIFLGLLTGLFLVLGTLWCIAGCCYKECGEPPRTQNLKPEEEDGFVQPTGR